MTVEIKCANCPTTVQRVYGPDDDATVPWLCPDCDADEGEGPAEDEGFGSEEQLRKADEFNGEPADIPYIRYLKAEGLLGGSFPDDKPATLVVVDKPAGWFTGGDDNVAGRPTKAQIAFTEKQLAKHGLAENQLHGQQDIQAVVEPIIEGSEFQGSIQQHQFDRGLDRRSWHSSARRRANGNELNDHHAVRKRTHQRMIPAWTMRDDQVRKVLGRLFPEHDKDARESAGRFLRIIYLYFRANQWVRTIAEAVGISVRAVENVVQRARKVGEEVFGSASSAVDAFRGDYWCCSELKAA